MPRDIKEGDKVVSGSVNLTGVITVKTESVYSESTVAKILDLVENSSSKKAKAENFITRFAKYYTPAVVIAAVVLAVLPAPYYRRRLERLAAARAQLPCCFLPLRACNFGSALILQRYRRRVKAWRAY